MTPVDVIRVSIKSWAEALRPETIRFMVQLDELVLLPILLCGIGYLLTWISASASQNPPSPVVWAQVLLCLAGWLITILLPDTFVQIDISSERLWLIIFSVFILTVGVYGLAFLLGFPAGHQKSVRGVLYAGILLLCLWTMFLKGC